MKTKTCTTKRSGMKTTGMQRNQRWNGTLMHSSKRLAASLHALLNVARIGTSHTLTRRRDATSCTLRKGRGRHPKAGILFFSLKAPKERAKAKENGKGKRKPGKGKGSRKGKGLKGKEPNGLGRILDDTCHFCKQPGHYELRRKGFEPDGL